MTNRTVLFVGGPEAGKSNFLFRLWLSLRAGTDSQVVPDGLPEDLSYLNDGAAAQLSGAFAEHTPTGFEARTIIPVLVEGKRAELIIPDRPGEDWKKFYEERRWPQGWMELLNPLATFLVFVRASNEVGQTKDWIALQHFLGPKINFGQDADHTKDPPPLQVILVDWIQLIAGLFKKRFGIDCRPRIGLIITAWDQLPKDGQRAGPMEYLRNDHKLLYDFIINNRDRMDLEVFGTSLFGGDLKDGIFSKALVDSGNLRKSGSVTHELNGSVEEVPDLVLPIAWALRVARQ